MVDGPGFHGMQEAGVRVPLAPPQVKSKIRNRSDDYRPSWLSVRGALRGISACARPLTRPNVKIHCPAYCAVLSQWATGHQSPPICETRGSGSAQWVSTSIRRAVADRAGIAPYRDGRTLLPARGRRDCAASRLVACQNSCRASDVGPEPRRNAAGLSRLGGWVGVLATLALGSASVVLRRAEGDDLAAIVGLLAADQLGATRDGASTAGDLLAYRRAFDAIDSDPAHILVVGQAGDDIVATMQLSFLPGLARRGALRAQIEAVHVHRDYRGRGLGTAMFGWAIGEAKRRGCALVQLTSDKSRADAHRFYRRLGFIASHEGLKLTL